MGLPQKNEERYTYGDYIKWPDDVRYELIEGVAYAMSPAPTRRHQDVVLEIGGVSRNPMIGERCQAANTTATCPTEAERRAGPTTICTSRPSRARQSSIFASLMPRN